MKTNEQIEKDEQEKVTEIMIMNACARCTVDWSECDGSDNCPHLSRIIQMMKGK